MSRKQHAAIRAAAHAPLKTLFVRLHIDVQPEPGREIAAIILTVRLTNHQRIRARLHHDLTQDVVGRHKRAAILGRGTNMAIPLHGAKQSLRGQTRHQGKKSERDEHFYECEPCCAGAISTRPRVRRFSRPFHIQTTSELTDTHVTATPASSPS